MTSYCTCVNGVLGTLLQDPASTRSRKRPKRGYHREVLQRRTNHHPNPALGGTRGYPLWQRYRALESLNNRRNYQIAAATVGCHEIYVRGWEVRVWPYRMAGGKQRKKLCGMDHMLL